MEQPRLELEEPTFVYRLAGRGGMTFADRTCSESDAYRWRYRQRHAYPLAALRLERWDGGQWVDAEPS